MKSGRSGGEEEGGRGRRSPIRASGDIEIVIAVQRMMETETETDTDTANASASDDTAMAMPRVLVIGIIPPLKKCIPVRTQRNRT